MKQRIAYLMIVATIVVMALCNAHIVDAYDSKVRVTMGKLKATVAVLKKSTASQDYFATAERFMDVARLLKGLDDISPSKGSKNDWDRMHGTIINKAFQGIGACGIQDDKAITRTIEDMFELISEGHRQFR